MSLIIDMSPVAPIITLTSAVIIFFIAIVLYWNNHRKQKSIKTKTNLKRLCEKGKTVKR
jgi:ABC-type nickel/cobalt efflux system permease component RcnA